MEALDEGASAPPIRHPHTHRPWKALGGRQPRKVPGAFPQRATESGTGGRTDRPESTGPQGQGRVTAPWNTVRVPGVAAARSPPARCGRA